MHTTYKDGRRKINDVGVTMQMHMRNAIIHHHVVEEPVTLPIYHILSEIQVSILCRNFTDNLGVQEQFTLKL